MTVTAAGILAWDPQTGVLIAMAMIILTLMWWSARRRTRRSTVDGRASTHAANHAARLERRATEDINELMVRLEELSREICGQIDTRFAKLEHSLNEADQKLAALRKAAAGAAADFAPGAEPVSSAAACPTSSASPTDAAQTRIVALADQGVTAVDIARQVEMTVGEVELVLSLERSRRAAAGVQPATPATAPANPPAPAPAPGLAGKTPAKKRPGRKKPQSTTLDERA